ncbi:MAG: Ribosomal RNA small subunit methyltransferase H [Microgenomates group bacterium GW2011_GWF2_47_9]|nr:MAG: Ribosomal RNA small subunit methyltransferase H [Microgenomates group bacterium GW2011_GWF2_47_9]
MTKILHTPVMLNEVTKFLAPEPGKRFFDATLGYAGHTLALLSAGATVVGCDRDQDILSLAVSRVKEAGFADKFTPLHSSFASAFDRPELGGVFDGILFDLGVSSYQLDTPLRGFSFRYNAPLDMRMDKDLAVTAADLVNGLGRKELQALFTELGEERNVQRLVNAIVETRKISPIKTTQELVSLIEKNLVRNSKIHKATKIFQALRMAVNSEREELKAALPSALSKLKLGGTLVTVSFHSLEDAIVKDFLVSEGENLELLGVGVITPGIDEVKANVRSRSAKLRAARRVK